MYTAPVHLIPATGPADRTIEFYVRDEDAQFYVIREWMTKQHSWDLYRNLKDTIPWQESKVRFMGKEMLSPRLTYFMADDNIPYHNYSGVSHPCSPWSHSCDSIRDAVASQFGVRFNSALLNYYRDGNDYIASHSDKEVGPPHFSVFGVSLGATRRFYLQSKTSKDKIKIEVRSGDLMAMVGRIQDRFTHTVPKQSLRALEEQGRISITFRDIAH